MILHDKHRILLILVAIISAVPGSQFWGVNHLTHLPSFHYALALAWVCLLLLLAAKKSVHDLVFTKTADLILESRRAQIVLLAGALALLAFFRTRTHFLGDGYLLLETLGDDTVIRPANSLGYFVISWLFSHFGRLAGLAPEAYYRIIAVICGGVGLVAMVTLVRETTWPKSKRILFLCLVCSSGPFLLNFGYVENYALLFFFSNCFVVSGVAYSHRRMSILWPSLFLGLAVLSHLAALIAVPALISLLLSGRRKPTSKDVLKSLVPLGVSMALVAVFFLKIGQGFDLFGAATHLDTNLQRPFRPLWGQDGVISTDNMISAANLLFLLSPAAVIGLVAGFRQLIATRVQQTNLFLICHSLFFLAFLLLVDPKLGAARDWDLFCVQGTGLIALAVNNFPDHKRAMILSVGMGFLFFVPWVLVNANTSSAVARFIEMNGTFPDYPRTYGFETLGKYYRTQGDQESSVRMYGEAVRALPRSPRFQTLLGASYISLFNQPRDRGAPDEKLMQAAESCYRAALALDPDDYRALRELAKLLVRRKEYLEAQQLLVKLSGHSRLDAESLLALGYCEYRLGQFEKAVASFEKARELDPSTKVEPWLSQARQYLAR